MKMQRREVLTRRHLLSATRLRLRLSQAFVSGTRLPMPSFSPSVQSASSQLSSACPGSHAHMGVKLTMPLDPVEQRVLDQSQRPRCRRDRLTRLN